MSLFTCFEYLPSGVGVLVSSSEVCASIPGSVKLRTMRLVLTAFNLIHLSLWNKIKDKAGS